MKAVTKERITILALIALLSGMEPTPPRIAGAIVGGCLYWWLAGRLHRQPPPEQTAPSQFHGKT